MEILDFTKARATSLSHNIVSPGGLMKGPGILYEFSIGLQICLEFEHGNVKTAKRPSHQITVYYNDNTWRFGENTKLEEAWEKITPVLLDLGVVCMPMGHPTVEKVTLPDLNLEM